VSSTRSVFRPALLSSAKQVALPASLRLARPRSSLLLTPKPAPPIHTPTFAPHVRCDSTCLVLQVSRICLRRESLTGTRKHRDFRAEIAFLVFESASDYDVSRFASRRSHKCQDHRNRSAKITPAATMIVIPNVGSECRTLFPAINSKTKPR